MRKILFIILGTFLLFFVGITIFKLQDKKTDVKDDNHGMVTAERENIKRFWETYRRATQLRVAGKTQMAAATYQEALKLNDQHEDAWYYLGNMHYDLGNLKDAEKAWKRLVEINPYSSRVHFQLGNLYLNFDYPEFLDLDAAETEFQRTHEINKEETAPSLHLGLIALIKENYTDALRYFDAVIGSNYRNVEAHFLKSFIFWERGDASKALQEFNEAVKYSKPEKPVKGVLGEGDTKAGPSFKKANRLTLISSYLDDLAFFDSSDPAKELEYRFKRLADQLARIRKTVKS